MKAKQFEIWMADLNPKIGTEPGKIRPVIIIQTDLLNKYHPSSIICPITTNVRKEIEILRIHLQKFQKQFPENNIQVIQIETNCGKGNALQAGILQAQHNWVLCNDADLLS